MQLKRKEGVWRTEEGERHDKDSKTGYSPHV